VEKKNLLSRYTGEKRSRASFSVDVQSLKRGREGFKRVDSGEKVKVRG